MKRADEAAAHLELPPVESPERSRALSCCLIGPTNAGKSTLLNALIDSHVSAVSAKIHTTRENTLGYLTDVASATQVEFVDAPGALGPDVPSLHRALWDAVRGAELAVVVVDAADVKSHRQVGRFLERLSRELDDLEESRKGRRPQTGESHAAAAGHTRPPKCELTVAELPTSALNPQRSCSTRSTSSSRRSAC